AVTDANLILGRYDPTRFAGGDLTLDASAAEAALLAAVGGPLGLESGMAALGVIEIVDENMANAARVHAIESGKTFEGRTLIAFGGGGPVHATRIAEKIGVARVLVPSGAGVGSAIGFLRAPIGYEVVQSLYQRLDRLDVGTVNRLLAGMVEQAAAVVAEGSFGSATHERRIAYMRYVGQGHEIAVLLPARALATADVMTIHAAYDAEYARFYNRPVPGSEVEIISFAVTVATDPPPQPPRQSGGEIVHAAAPVGRRKIRDTATGEIADWAVYDRDNLGVGARFEGPAIVDERETSSLVGAGWRGRINAEGFIELTKDHAR
ncbi:MAG TPA: hydantoinase/oxoprolinase family protein, partial [Roseiarcus sp.]|nr:hydantoinase/oxoprolinase family protein [Roseiarcus sp.]